MRKRSRDLLTARRALGAALGVLDLAEELGQDTGPALAHTARAARELFDLVATAGDRSAIAGQVAELRGDVATVTGRSDLYRPEDNAARIESRWRRLGWTEQQIAEAAAEAVPAPAPVAPAPAAEPEAPAVEHERIECHKCGRVVSVVGGVLDNHRPAGSGFKKCPGSGLTPYRSGPRVECSGTDGLVTVDGGEPRGRVVHVEGEDTATPYEARTLANVTISAWSTRREAIAAVAAYDPEPEPEPAPAPATEGARFALVACGKSKQNTPGEYPATELYTGGLFGMVRREVEHRTGAGELGGWFILSALHGLVQPTDWLERYDHKLTAGKRDAWGAQVAAELLQHVGAGDTVEIHAGKLYAPASLVAALDSAGVRVEYVARGLQVGERRALYSARWAERGAV